MERRSGGASRTFACRLANSMAQVLPLCAIKKAGFFAAFFAGFSSRQIPDADAKIFYRQQVRLERKQSRRSSIRHSFAPPPTLSDHDLR